MNSFLNRYGTWVLWAFWALILSLLSYFSIPTWAAGGLLLLGGLLALGLRHTEASVDPSSSRMTVPIWLWVLVILGAVFARCYQLTTLSTWPITDEGYHGFFALDLLKTGVFRFFYTVARFPPLYIWSLAGFFKLFSPSLFSLWLFPALISLLAVFFAYWGSRRVGSPLFTFLYTAITALSFWPVYAARYSHPAVLMMLWEQIALWRLLCFWQSLDDRRPWESFWLGLVVGTGFYTFTAWPVAAVAFSLPVLMGFFQRKSGALRETIAFFSPAFLFLAPLAWRMWKDGYGEYLRYVSQGDRPSTLSHLKAMEQYLSAPFWGVGIHVSFYSPVWGGFLNPVLGALFFLGLFAFARQNKTALWWPLAAIALFWLPGLLTNGQELFRIVLLCPLFLAGAAWGLMTLLKNLAAVGRVAAMALLLVLSVGLDSHHLYNVYPDMHVFPEVHQFWRPVELAQANDIIHERSKKDGPFLFLSEFTLKPTLAFSVATYEQDALENPVWANQKPRQAVVLTNPNYEPFLKKRFPKADWTWLEPENRERDTGLLLGFIPINPENEKNIARLALAQKTLQTERDRSQYENINYDWQSSIERLRVDRAAFEGDSFLESVYWERLAFYGSFQGHLDEVVADLSTGVKKGYPAANLYYSLGMFLGFEGKGADAKKAFEMARKAPVDRTSASARLQEMNAAKH